MIAAQESVIRSVSIHRVGNAALEEPLKISEAPLELDDEKVTSLLKTYFLANFNTPEYFRFSDNARQSSINIHEVFRGIFDEPEAFHESSLAIAQHLYESAKHPSIKAGDLFVVYFSTLPLNGQHTEAIGIFKSETKDSFLKLKTYANQFDILADEGINVRKLDKGCLILNTDPDDGYRVLIVDNPNKGEASFWKNEFLGLDPVSDAFHQTQQLMNMTRQFVAEQIPEDFQVSRADQIDLLNRSANYFKTREEFNQAEFESEVLGDAEVIESFRNYGKNFMANAEYDPEDNFQISAHAVKRQVRVFKSVLKLDKNFHIYIHGSRELIEKGYDEEVGKHYYKIWFDEET